MRRTTLTRKVSIGHGGLGPLEFIVVPFTKVQEPLRAPYLAVALLKA
jgi:hypothetical protein